MSQVPHIPQRRYSRLLYWLLALSPLWLIFALVAAYGVDMPRLDEWECIDLVSKLHDGKEISWMRFFEPANDSRPALPRLIILILSRFTHWNTRYEMFFTLGLLGANILMLARLFHRSPLGASGAGANNAADAAPLTAVFLSALAICSPWQQELLWGYQMLVQLPMTLMLCGFSLVNSRLKTPWVIGFCGLFSLGATFSYANGMLVWPILLACLLASRPADAKKYWYLLVGYLTAFLCTVIFYFDTLDRSTAPPMAFARLDFLPNLLSFFGAPLASFHGTFADFVLSAILGGVLLALLLIVAIFAVREWRFKPLLQTALPFLLVCGYACISGFAATAGRITMATEKVWASTRYAAFTTYFLAALIFLVLALFRALPGLSITPLRSRLIATRTMVLSLLAGGFLMAEIQAYGSSISNMVYVYRIYRQHRAALIVADHLVIPETAGTVFWDAWRISFMAAQLHDRGMLRPILPPHAFDAPNLSTKGGGSVDAITVEGDKVLVSGWAYVFSHRRPADCVIFTSLIDGQNQPFAVVFPSFIREDLRPYPWARDLTAGFLVEIHPPATVGGETGTTRIQGWAVDGDSGAVYALHMPNTSATATNSVTVSAPK